MEYQKITNLFDNTANQPSLFRANTCVEINGDSRGTYNTNSQIKFKNTKLKSSLSNYSDAYILVKTPIIVTRWPATADAATKQSYPSKQK